MSRATLWYIAVPGDPEKLSQWKRLRAMAVPVSQLDGLSTAEQEKGRQRHLKQKAACQAERNSKDVRAILIPYELSRRGSVTTRPFFPLYTILASQSTLVTLILLSDFMITRHLIGSLIKLMDNVAGICAARHCNSHVVTACINATDFYFMSGRSSLCNRKSCFHECKINGN